MERLFNDLELIINSDLTSREKGDEIIYTLCNNDIRKGSVIISKTANKKYDYKQVKYAIVGNEKTKLADYNDKFMWLLRYGFCDGDEELTKTMFEIVTGVVYTL